MQFPKMPCNGDSDAPDWVALEKIHGSQLVIGVTRDDIQVGNRKRWLCHNESFFGWQLLRAFLHETGRRAFERVNQDAVQLMLYGELFGGRYPHPDIREASALQPVQTGVWYAPDLRWALFEILVLSQGPGAEALFLGYSETRALADEIGVLTPPRLALGSRTKVLDLPVRFPSRMGIDLGLPPLSDNLSEGYVAKPDARMPISRYTTLKRKREEMEERRFDESIPWDPLRILPPDVIFGIADGLVNKPRLDSAASKVGRVDDRQILLEAVLDVLIDLEEAFPAAISALDAQVRQDLERRIEDRARQLLQPKD